MMEKALVYVCNYSSRGERTNKFLQKSSGKFSRYQWLLLGHFRNETSRNNAKYQEHHAAKTFQNVFCILWWSDITA
eukprot:TRINITY_DN4514_c0_g1_i1.p3 TRINITY_DN4514_c0_g1~~TRINITY_DN4514_c0_g1_i1.p3  ORF type:complete len:76 (+),score=12.62 TRINITY_DN4514_c0_g1_i1:269-496(+)